MLLMRSRTYGNRCLKRARSTPTRRVPGWPSRRGRSAPRVLDSPAQAARRSPEMLFCRREALATEPRKELLLLLSPEHAEVLRHRDFPCGGPLKYLHCIGSRAQYWKGISHVRCTLPPLRGMTAPAVCRCWRKGPEIHPLALPDPAAMHRMLATSLDREHCALWFELVPGCGKLRRCGLLEAKRGCSLLASAGVKTGCRIGRRLRCTDFPSSMCTYMRAKYLLLWTWAYTCACFAGPGNFLAFCKIDVLARFAPGRGRPTAGVCKLLQGRFLRAHFFSGPESWRRCGNRASLPAGTCRDEKRDPASEAGRGLRRDIL